MTLTPADELVHTDPGALPSVTQRLAFRIRRLRPGEPELAEVARLRMASYARHGLDLLPPDCAPQADEFADGSSLLMAQRRVDGVVLGTVRVQTNQVGPLKFEQDYALPDHLNGHRLIGAWRFCVQPGPDGQEVSRALFKAFLIESRHAGAAWAAVAARRPLDRMYARLGFQAFDPQKTWFDPVLRCDHRVMGFHIARAEALWAERRHPWADYMFRVEHPDIEL